MADSLLKQFGRVRELIEVKPNNPISLIIGKWIDDSIKKSKQILAENNKNASGRLTASIAPLPVSIDENGNMEWTIEMEDYWDEVDEGVNGTNIFRNSTKSFIDKGPSVKDLQMWIADKGIQPLDSSMTYEQLARVFQKSIKQKGFEGVKFVSLVFNQNELDKLMKDIEALWQ
jgi:hypothetical protein